MLCITPGPALALDGPVYDDDDCWKIDDNRPSAKLSLVVLALEVGS